MNKKDPKNIIYDFMIFFVNTKIREKKMYNFIAEMSTYLHKSPLEVSIKQKKIDKLMSLKQKLNSLKNLKNNVKLIACLWLELCCKKIVISNGFFTIERTLNYLGLNIVIDKNNNLNNELENYIIKNYEKFINTQFLPLNCEILNRKNKNKNKNKNSIKCFRIRPSLVEIEGKLYGLCIELEQSEYTARFFGLIDPDMLRLYRKQLPKKEIFNDLYNRYKINKEEAKPYLDCLSYRDYLELETRQITNKIKQLKEKFDFYKTADLSILLSEYQFLNEYFRIEMISLLLELVDGLVYK